MCLTAYICVYILSYYIFLCLQYIFPNFSAELSWSSAQMLEAHRKFWLKKLFSIYLRGCVSVRLPVCVLCMLYVYALCVCGTFLFWCRCCCVRRAKIKNCCCFWMYLVSSSDIFSCSCARTHTHTHAQNKEHTHTRCCCAYTVRTPYIINNDLWQFQNLTNKILLNFENKKKEGKTFPFYQRDSRYMAKNAVDCR